MVDSNDLDFILFWAVDEAMAAKNDFPNILDTQLRDDSPRAWMVSQPIRGMENPAGEHGRNWRGVPGNEETNRL